MLINLLEVNHRPRNWCYEEEKKNCYIVPL